MADMSIKTVVCNGLCTGCGACVVACKKDAIALNNNGKVYVPYISNKLCNNCGNCLTVCPGHEVDFIDLRNQFFRTKTINNYIGSVVECYHGYIYDQELRNNCASGGMITGILLYALEKGIIDGAIVTKMNPIKPFEPLPFLATTREDIIESARSKYCPVPVNIALKEIIGRDGKYAVVGLPCHLQALRKMERKDIELRDKIVLRLGIMCSHNVTFKATEYIISSLKLRKNEIVKISYRGNGWPGELSFLDCYGKAINIPYKRFGNLHFMHYFINNRCLLCCDQNCELSDISFGDAWLKKYKEKDKIGHSFLVTRTQEGNQIIRKAFEENYIYLDEIDIPTLIESQKDVLHFKKNTINVFLKINKILNKSVPSYNTVLFDSNINDYLLFLIFEINRFISERQSLWFAIKYLLILELGLAKILDMIFKRKKSNIKEVSN